MLTLHPPALQEDEGEAPEIGAMIFRVLALFLLLLQVAWPQTKLDWSTPFAVDGIRLGDTRQQVFKALGAPRENTRGKLDVWKYKDLEVSFQGDTVARLYGSALQQNKQSLIRVGELANVVRGRFGEPENNEALGVQHHPEVDVMMYQNETTTIGVFTRAGRVSLVGLSRR